MSDSLMISGYCRCGFPAAYRCTKCREKLCGNCLPRHVCTAEVPKLQPPQSPAEPNDDNQSEAVRDMTRKPGRPKIRK